MYLLATTAKGKREKSTYLKIYHDLKDGTTFSNALINSKVGTLDTIQFLSMAEQGVNFKNSLEKVVKYLKIKDEFERESNSKTSIPFFYLVITTLVVIGIKFFAVPYELQRAKGYSQEIIQLISNHLAIAQIMTDLLFFGLLAVASYFFVLMTALFGKSFFIQNAAKSIGLILPLTSSIVMKFEKFMLFSMLGGMLQSGVSFKNSMQSAIKTSSVKKFKNALLESLKSIKYEGKFLFHSTLYDETEKGLLLGVGSSHQIGAIMLEISSKARTDALALSTKFFQLINLLSILLMAFAVFIEFYTVVLTQMLIQKGLIDLSKGVGTY